MKEDVLYTGRGRVGIVYYFAEGRPAFRIPHAATPGPVFLIDAHGITYAVLINAEKPTTRSHLGFFFTKVQLSLPYKDFF